MTEEEHPTEDSPQEATQAEVQLFTVAFNPVTAEVAFLGSMSTEQALGLMQRVLKEQETARIRRELEAELTKKKQPKRKKT